MNGLKANIAIKVDSRSAARIDALSKSVDVLNSKLTTTNRLASNLSTTLQSLGTSFAGLNKTQQAAVGIQKTNAAIQKTATVSKHAGTELEQFGKQAALAIRRFSAFTVAVGAVFGFIRAIGEATSEAIDFDKQLVKISQVTGTSLRNLQPLVKEITRLSVGLGVSSKELLEVAQTLSQAGLSANDTRKALEALAKSSLAPSFVDMKNTTEAAIAAMSQFNLEARDLENVLGSINAVAAGFAAEAEDLAKVIRITGGVFATAGSQLDDPKKQLNELLSLFTAVRSTTRVSAENIATGFNTIFARIQRPQTIEFLRNFNIELTDAQGRFVGVFEAVNRLNQGLNQFQAGDLQLASIFEQLGGFRQIKNIIPLIQQFGKAQQALKVAQEGQDSLTKDATTAQLSLANSITKVKEQFITLIREISNTDTFRLISQSVLTLTSQLIRLADVVKPIIPVITAVAGIKAIGAGAQFITGFNRELFSRQGTNAPAANNGGLAAALTQSSNKSNEASLLLKAALDANTQAIRALTAAILSNRVNPFGGVQTKKNSGGLVPGIGNTDSVVGALTPGEFVIRKSAVRKIGLKTLNKMNKYAQGGPVRRGKGIPSAITPFSNSLGEDIEINFRPVINLPQNNLPGIPYNPTSPSIQQFKNAQLGNSAFQFPLTPFSETTDVNASRIANPKAARPIGIPGPVGSPIGIGFDDLPKLADAVERTANQIATKIVQEIGQSVEQKSKTLTRLQNSLSTQQPAAVNKRGSSAFAANVANFGLAGAALSTSAPNTRRTSALQSRIAGALGPGSSFDVSQFAPRINSIPGVDTSALFATGAKPNRRVRSILPTTDQNVQRQIKQQATNDKLFAALAKNSSDAAVARQLASLTRSKAGSGSISNLTALGFRDSTKAKVGVNALVEETDADRAKANERKFRQAVRVKKAARFDDAFNDAKINQLINAGVVTREDLTQPPAGGRPAPAAKPSFLSRFKFKRGTQLSPEQLSQRNALLGGAAVTAGLIGASFLEGRGVSGKSAASGLTSGLVAGGLASSAVGGPAGAIVGVTAGIVSALDTFLSETNRIAIEAKELSFKESIDKLDKSTKRSNLGVNALVAETQGNISAQLALKNAPNRNLNTAIGQRSGFLDSFSGEIQTNGFTNREIAAASGYTGLIKASLFGDTSGVEKQRKENEEFQKLADKEVTDVLFKNITRRIQRGETTARDATRQFDGNTRGVIANSGRSLNELFDVQKIKDAESSMNSLRLTISRLADTFDLSTAKVTAANQAIELQTDKQNELARVLLSGGVGGSIRGSNRNSQIFGNVAGSTTAELQGALKSIGGGGSSGSILKSFQALEQNIPRILGSLNVAAGNPDSIIADFNKQIKTLNLAKPLEDVIKREFSTALSSDEENFDAKKAVREFNPLGGEVGNLRSSALGNVQALASGVQLATQQYIDSVTNILEAQEAYRGKLLETIEIQTQAREAAANAVGSDPLRARQQGINQRNAALGFQNANGLGGRINALTQRGAALRGQLSSARTPEEAARFGTELQKVNDELIKAKQALEVFARDTSLASLAADKLQKAQTKIGVGRELAGNILGSGRGQFVKQIGALERFQGGDLRTLITSFDDLQAGIEFQAKFLRAQGNEKGARQVENQFDTAIGQVLGPEFAAFMKGAKKEEADARALQKQAADLQIQAANETIKAQQALLGTIQGAGPRRARGGPVYGAGTGTSDSINAKLSNGEYVIRAAAVNRIGKEAFDYMNANGELPGFAAGGPVVNPRQRFRDRHERAARRRLARLGRLGQLNTVYGDAARLVAGGGNINGPGGRFKFDSGFVDARTGRVIGIGPLDRARVDRRAAANAERARRRKAAGFASGGLVTTGNGGIALDGASLSSLNAFVVAANNLSASLASVNIPTQIQLTGTHQVNVNLNGATVLSELLNGPLGGMIQEEVKKALSRYDQSLRG